MTLKKISGPSSGFPELLPELRRVEQQWNDTIRQIFESYGFASIETSAIEEVKTITAKGEDVDKEIYGLRRLKEDSNEPQASTLGLHFDLTVPLARYVSQNYNDLTFPFKRYQMQKVWRGERPQEGRYREFGQCDIDVVDNKEVALQFDAEMPLMIHKVFEKLGIDDITTNINNRKIIQGYYMGLGISDPMHAIRIVDKVDKIGPDGVSKMLKSRMNLSDDVIEKCLQMAEIKTTDNSFAERIECLGVKNDLLAAGCGELKFVIESLSSLPHGSVVANMAISRGLDYYTGTVYEGKFTTYPDFPTIYAGGRYENLLSNYFNKKVPGVGISIGLTRTLLKLYKENRIQLSEKSPTDVLIVQTPEMDYKALVGKAQAMRDNGVNVEVYHDAQRKTGAQIQYAVKKGIRYALFATANGDEVKDLISGQQVGFDIRTWTPDRRENYQTRIFPSPKKSVLKAQC
jgi:histidyl-tRNA synthetase